MTIRGLHLHFDCVSGIAGDMTLAAMLHLGVPRSVVADAFDAIGLGADRLSAHSVRKRGIAATAVKIDVQRPLSGDRWSAHEHAHEHAHEQHREHSHYHYGQIRHSIASSDLSPGVRRRALDIFDRIARAEARIHGLAMQDVSLHEVGAIDSIADVVAAAAALEYLAPHAVTCHGVAMGYGTLTCAHGVLPVPSPAALEILRECGGKMLECSIAHELCTPTGAAILAHAVTSWTHPPTGVPVAIGWGAGDRDLPDRANAVRVVVLKPSAERSSQAEASMPPAEDLWELRCNLDDINHELIPDVIDQVMSVGAVDAWHSAITMKKGRPALQLGVLCTESVRTQVLAVVFRETTTLGVRWHRVHRDVLERSHAEVTTVWGRVRVKIGRYGGTTVNIAPEYADCRALAMEVGVSTKQVWLDAIASARELWMESPPKE